MRETIYSIISALVHIVVRRERQPHQEGNINTQMNEPPNLNRETDLEIELETDRDRLLETDRDRSRDR